VSSRSIAGSTARAVTADAGRRFDWLVLAAIAWLVGGLFADGWAHNNALPDSFWTVWHAIFYSGYAACAAVLLGAIALRRPAAATWGDAIPRGYRAAVAGIVAFGIGWALRHGVAHRVRDRAWQ